MLRVLHCSEIEPSTSEQRNQRTNHHPRLDGVTTYTAYQREIQHEQFYQYFIF